MTLPAKIANDRPENYALVQKDNEQYIVHTSGSSVKPLLVSYRIGEPDESKAQRAMYAEPVTVAYFNRFFDQVSNILKKGLVSISMDGELRENVEMQINPLSFYSDEALRRTFDDPNGYLVIMPTEDFNVSELSDTSKPIRLVLRYIPYKNIRLSAPNKIVFEHGLFIYEISSNRYYRQTNEKVPVADLGWSIEKELSLLPFVQLGGYPSICSQTGVRYFKSFTDGAFLHAKLAIQSLSDWRVSLTQLAHPITIIRGAPCTNALCNNGKVSHVNTIGEQEYHNCADCNGSGKRTISLSMGMVIETEADPFADPNKSQDDPSTMINYVQPPTDSIASHENAYDKHLNEYRENLYIVFINQVQSGEAKKEDRRAQTSTIDKIGAHIYDRIIYLYNVAARLMYPNIVKESNITATLPVSFTNTTIEGIFELINELKGVSAPSVMVSQAYVMLARQIFPNEPIKSRIIQWCLLLNPYFSKTDEEMLTMFATGAIMPSDLLLHLRLGNYLYNLSETDSDFLSYDYETIKQKTDAYLATLPKPQVPAPVI